MDTFHHLVQAILVIVLIYAIALILKRRGILNEEHSLILARIVTSVCLPAIIFVSLSQQLIQWKQLTPALVMLGLELTFIALAWIVSTSLKFSKAQQGAIVFCSAFGSSAFLGYAIIIEMFPQKPEALTEAVFISEIGVGYPIFILGPILAAYFGAAKSNCESLWSSSLKFMKSPVFFALILGFLWGFFKLPGKENAYLAPFFHLFKVLASALTPIAILSVGLMFKMPRIKSILLALGTVILFKLFLKPLLAGTIASLLDFPILWKDVLVLLAAMPPAVLGVVFLRRFGGDASLASALLLTATILSCVSLLIVFWLIT